MVKVLASELVVDQLALVLDDSRLLLRYHPQVAAFGADAAVAPGNRLDLGCLELEDEGAAVAVAAVLLGGRLRLRHSGGGDGGLRWLLLQVQHSLW